MGGARGYVRFGPKADSCSATKCCYSSRVGPRLELMCCLGWPDPADKPHLFLVGGVRCHHDDLRFSRAKTEHYLNILTVGDHHQRAWSAPRFDHSPRTSGQFVAHGVQYEGIVESGRVFYRTDVHQFGGLHAAAPLGS